MKQSKIAWTDFSGGNLNFVTGCTPVSAGCENCYARRMYERFHRDHSVVQTHPEKLHRLRTQTFRKEVVWEPYDGGRYICTKPGEHSVWRSRNGGTLPLAFACDTGDLFHEDVPDAFLMEAFMVMLHRTDVIWQVLTKRPERMRDFIRMFVNPYVDSWPMGNIWLGVTAENQAMADERIPILLDTPAKVRWVSVEPMLGPVSLNKYLRHWCDECGQWHSSIQCWRDEEHPKSVMQRGVDWVVCGAESGPSRRPFDVAWAVDLYRQTRMANTAFFYKQGAAMRPGQHDELPGIGTAQRWPHHA